ncbi:MAG: M24 family metallopeptidase [Holosporales bacterium]|jgi:Xaa-Pro aminopeptidase|nr:M24 family metallopeptidase [Holosporales bacterium]
MDFNLNLKKLRNKLSELCIDSILVSMNSSFENTDESFSDIRFISGFSGSNGRAIVSLKEAILSVDGRYTKQAIEQTDAAIWKIELYPVVDTIKMIEDVLEKGNTLGVGALSVTYKTYLSILKLSQKLGFKILPMARHPVQEEKKITKSNVSLTLMNEEHMGESIKSRIERVKETLQDNEAALLADKVMIGWIFGIRRSELSKDKSVLANCIAFIPKLGMPAVFCDLELKANQTDFEMKHFNEFESYINNIEKVTVNLNYNNTPAYFALILEKSGFKIKPSEKEFGSFEIIKNKTEITNQKSGAELTSLAFIKTLSFLENTKQTSETEIAKFFENKIMENKHAIGLSFTTISAFKDNTSIVHYNPFISGGKEILGDGLFLLDAGAHFNNSTTDMTRVVYRGDSPPEEYKIIYSNVLKSLIMFSTAHFPDNSYAACIDSIARIPIWNLGYDYAFGTGHGVGCAGNVHEPPRISQLSQDKLNSSIILTVEPGIYKENFGMRLENMLLTKPSSKNPNFIHFETLNFIPFCRKLIRRDIFENSEIDWLNDYHFQTLKKFKDKLGSDEIAINWLEENTKEI